MPNREAKRHGLQLGAYDGARKRRFVVFHPSPSNGSVYRSEFDTKRERDIFAERLIKA